MCVAGIRQREKVKEARDLHTEISTGAVSPLFARFITTENSNINAAQNAHYYSYKSAHQRHTDVSLYFTPVDLRTSVFQELKNAP